MADPSFAQPLSKLGALGIGVAAAPSGGMGLALDPIGAIPISVLQASLLVQVNEGLISPASFLKVGRKTATCDGGGNITVTYDAPFPTATDYVIAIACAASVNFVYRIGSQSASQFVAFFNAATQAEDFFWLALGH